MPQLPAFIVSTNTLDCSSTYNKHARQP
eukprot:COSAG05_NODE_7914_length_756_cov_1.406393_1_plen_27_part_10